MAAPIEFKVADGDGDMHDYIVTLHGVDGLPIVMALAAEVGPTLLGALASSPAVLQKAFKAMSSPDHDVQISELIGDLNLPAAAAELRTALADPRKSARLIRDIMHHAIRDGEKMRDDAKFATAYRGNWFELLQATWRIVQENRFFPRQLTGGGSARLSTP